MPKQRKKRKTGEKCLGCSHVFFDSFQQLEHIFSEPNDCRNSYSCCFMCRRYVGTPTGLQRHLRMSDNCRSNNTMNNNPTSVELPKPIDALKINKASQKNRGRRPEIVIDPSDSYNDIDFNDTDLYEKDRPLPMVSNAYSDPRTDSSTPMFVQFGNFFNQFDKEFLKDDHLEHNASLDHILKKLNQRAGKNISSTSTKYKSVRSTLPGFDANDQQLILNSRFLRRINERDVTDSEEDNESNVSSENRDHDADAQEDEETLRLIQLPTSNRTENRNLEQDDNNINNVLNGLEVKFPIDENTGCEDARGIQQRLKSYTENIIFTREDDCLLDLYKILQTANVPKNMFNKIVDWTIDHKEVIGAGKIRRREKVMKHWFTQLGGGIFTPLPTVTNLVLPSGNTVTMTTFSLRNYILDLINDEMFHHSNLLIDYDDPCKIPENDGYLGEPNSGSWYEEAVRLCCTTPKHFLLNIGFFIDELKLDKYGRLASEVVLGCYQGFVRAIRLTERAWFPLGFVENQSNFKDVRGYVKETKMQDYHEMIAHIFRELRSIFDNGGIKVDLDYGTGTIHKDIIIVPVIQYIIGDCKGNDVHCGRKGTHVLTTPRLCRDCNIPSLEADNVHYRCEYSLMSDYKDKSKEELAAMSHYKIDNAWHDLPFGGCPHNIHASCPPEILHNLQLGKCSEIGRDLSFTDAANEHVSVNFSRIYPFLKCQSERNIPMLRPFRDGISSVKSLKATERHARVFAVYLSVMNPFLVKTLQKYKKAGQDDPTMKNTIHSIKRYVTVLEDTLMIHEWLKSPTISRHLLEGIFESPAYKRIMQYSQMFKEVVVLDKLACMTTKFHQLLHVVMYILRYGVPRNFDGSIGELMGKHFAKDMSKSTNKDKDTLNMNIAIRIAEKRTTERLSRIRDGQRKQSSSSKLMPRTTRECGTTNKSFTLIKRDIQIENIPENAIQMSIEVKWKQGIKPPLTQFPNKLLIAVVNRLYHWNPSLGGALTSDSIVSGFTDYRPPERQDLLFRANPHFRTKGEWFDWAYFDWGEEGMVPGRILMFLDLSDCTITYNPNDNSDTIEDLDDLMEHIPERHHLKKEKFALIQSATSKRALSTDPDTKLTDRHFDMKLSFWVEMEQKFRIVPLSCLNDAAFAFDTIPYDDADEKDNTALVVRAMDEWGDLLFAEVAGDE